MPSTITSEQWEERKEKILRLYIVQGLALKPVMRAMRTHDFDPSESQYRTRLKKWQRRKPRNSHQAAPSTTTNIRNTVSSPLRLAATEIPGSSAQTNVPLNESFAQPTMGGFTQPYPFEPVWLSGAVDVQDSIQIPPVAAPTVNDDFTQTQRQWPDVVPLGSNQADAMEQFVEATRREFEERRSATHGFTGQPRVERTARLRVPASRQLKSDNACAVDAHPTLAQAPLRPSWDAQPVALGGSLAPPDLKPAPEGEGSWWYLPQV